MYMKSKIIVGYAGIGKTYLGNTFSDVIDIDSSDYHWIYHNLEIACDIERRKDCIDRELNPAWPSNYIEAISQLYDQEKYSYILVVFKIELLPLLFERGLPFIIVAPREELKEEYRQRYIDRNNTDAYISRMLLEWDDDMRQIKKCSDVYYLDSCEHLTDFVAVDCALEIGQGCGKKKVYRIN